MPSPVRRETHKNQKYVEGKPKSLMKSSYLTRPTDFLLGTKTGQFVSIMVMWVFLVFLGALFFYWAGGSRAMDLGLPHDNFWDSLWASYVLFIDIGTAMFSSSAMSENFNHIPQILRRTTLCITMKF